MQSLFDQQIFHTSLKSCIDQKNSAFKDFYQQLLHPSFVSYTFLRYISALQLPLRHSHYAPHEWVLYLLVQYFSVSISFEEISFGLVLIWKKHHCLKIIFNSYFINLSGPISIRNIQQVLRFFIYNTLTHLLGLIPIRNIFQRVWIFPYSCFAHLFDVIHSRNKF